MNNEHRVRATHYSLVIIHFYIHFPTNWLKASLYWSPTAIVFLPICSEFLVIEVILSNATIKERCIRINRREGSFSSSSFRLVRDNTPFSSFFRCTFT